MTREIRRKSGRSADQLRDLKITVGFVPVAEGSVLLEMGSTRVICTASIEDRVPPFLKDSGSGWITAEYSMLPRATNVRTQREANKGKLGGRTHEIQRLIGRSLRSVVDMKLLGERTITLDCDVIQADGGTRTASITGACVALSHSIKYALEHGMLLKSPLKDTVSAISVGMDQGGAILDLDYDEDYRAEVDMNVVMTGAGRFVEVQGTAEHATFDRPALDAMLALAAVGNERLKELQRQHIPAGILS